MRISVIRKLVPLAIGLAMLPVTTGANTLFSVRAEHPRILATQSDLDALRSDLQVDKQFVFPAEAGSIRFKVNSDGTAANLAPILDKYDDKRDHMFIRHCVNPAYCKADNQFFLQITLQAVGGAYIANYIQGMSVGETHDIKIDWSSISRKMTVSVDGGIPNERTYNTSSGFALRGQYFQLSPNQANRLSDVDVLTPAGVSAIDGSNLRPVFRDRSNPLWRTLYVWNRIYESARTAASVVSSCNTSRQCDDINIRYSNGSNFINLHGGPGGVRNLAEQLAFSYQLTKEPQFLAGARDYLAQLARVPIDATDGEYSQGGRLYALGLLYDWLFDQLSQTERDAAQMAIRTLLFDKTASSVKEAICGWGDSLYLLNQSDGIACNFIPSPMNFVALTSHEPEDYVGVMAAVLAVASEYPEYNKLLQYLGPLAAEIIHATEVISADGGHHTGYYYGALHLGLRMTLLAELQSALSPLPAELSGPDLWINRGHIAFMYGLRADHSYPALGDSLAADTSMTVAAFPTLAAAVKGNDGDALAFYDKFMIENREIYSGGELLLRPQKNSQPSSSLPNSVSLGPLGIVLVRDSWDYSNATLLQFKSGIFRTGAHAHLDENSFTLDYKKPLLTDSGYYDCWASQHMTNYSTRTVAHNSLLVFDATETFRSQNDPPNYSRQNDGGQSMLAIANPTLAEALPPGANSLIGLIRYFDHGQIVYMRGDASKSYSSNKIDQHEGFVRDVLFLQPGYIGNAKPVTLVFDKVNATAAMANTPKRILFHSVNEPTGANGIVKFCGINGCPVLGNSFRLDNGEGHARVRTILPAEANLVKVGGIGSGGVGSADDYRFALPTASTTYAVTDANGTTITVPKFCEPHVETDASSWRIEVSSRTPSQHEFFLHAISVGDSQSAIDAESLSVTVLNDDDHYLVIEVGTHEKPGRIIALPKHSDLVMTQVNLGASARHLSEVPGIMVLGLAAGNYALIGGGDGSGLVKLGVVSQGTGLPVSSEGIVEWEAPQIANAISAGSPIVSDSNGDVPLPAWALGVLGGVLLASMRVASFRR